MLMQTEACIAWAMEPLGTAERSSSDATSSADLSWCFIHTHTHTRTPPDNAFTAYITLTPFPSELSPLAGLHHLFILLSPAFLHLSLPLRVAREHFCLFSCSQAGDFERGSCTENTLGKKHLITLQELCTWADRSQEGHQHVSSTKQNIFFGCSATNNGRKGRRRVC